MLPKPNHFPTLTKTGNWKGGNNKWAIQQYVPTCIQLKSQLESSPVACSRYRHTLSVLKWCHGAMLIIMFESQHQQSQSHDITITWLVSCLYVSSPADTCQWLPVSTLTNTDSCPWVRGPVKSNSCQWFSISFQANSCKWLPIGLKTDSCQWSSVGSQVSAFGLVAGLQRASDFAPVASFQRIPAHAFTVSLQRTSTTAVGLQWVLAYALVAGLLRVSTVTSSLHRVSAVAYSPQRRVKSMSISWLMVLLS